jgi:hypothetical protein
MYSKTFAASAKYLFPAGENDPHIASFIIDRYNF